MKNSIKILILISYLFPFFINSDFCFSQYKYDFRVNDDATTKYQNAAKLDVDKDGNFVIVWQDQRNMSGPIHPSYDIYFQRFDYNGEFQGNNFKINFHDSAAYVPNIIMKKDGGFIIAWQEGVYVGQWVDSINYFIRIYNKFGIPISERIKVNDSIFTCPITEPPAIGISNSNNIFIVMTMIQGLYGSNHIYLQKLDSLGNKIGINEMVNDNISNKNQDYPDISIRNDGSFIIVWQDYRIGSGDIYMQKYNTLGQKIGTNVRVNDDPVNPSIVHGEPSVSSDSFGNFCIAWDDSRESSGGWIDIYCQKYDTSFNLIGSNFKVNQGSYWERGNAIIKKRNNGYFVIGWSDYWANGQGWCPYFRRFSNANQFIGNQHGVTIFNPSQDKYLEDMTLWCDRIISIWRDWRNGNGDIFCNILSFQNPDSIINNISINSNNLFNGNELKQNYPNPFNSSTKISYKINKNSYIKIIIYDILGKEVTTLINKIQTSGEYQINFLANDFNLSSGIYFYKLYSNGELSDTKKLVILK
jgi:hypothetical protein